jgi:hypothetical protein
MTKTSESAACAESSIATAENVYQKTKAHLISVSRRVTRAIYDNKRRK